MSQQQAQPQGAPDRAAARADDDPALSAGYAPPGTVFDELRSASANPSPWDPLLATIDRIGIEGISTSWRRGEELLREHGIAHNLLSEAGETERRWDLDPIPLILPEAEWEFLSRAVIQRAHLWNRILHDCYGPQRLLHSGLLPARLLYSARNFNRSLRNLPAPDKPLLSLYAVDVARGPDGSWTVVADRTEAPNGMGLALENRIVVTNVFPETSRRMHLLRLAPYFQALRAMLFSHVPNAVDTPRVVLLSPGPGDRTYFEDAYLSRYLGITLAVGEELTVRGDRLYLKTVRGLQRVHVLVRRVPDQATDPLENPTDSHLGIPGLIQVMRAGAVTVVNPPGTGIAEAPAFLPVLPTLARELLGEDLLVPSIETHWGGDPNPTLPLDTAGSVIKSAFGRNLFRPYLSRQMSEEQLTELRGSLQQHPERYVVQKEMPFSTAPAWNGSSLEPRPVAVRLFLCAQGDRYHVMPGGLVRCAPQPDSLPGLSLHEDTSSKDLWIISARERPAVVPTNFPAFQPLRRNNGTLASRAADNMFWIGRYSERAEYATRILLEAVTQVTDEQDSTDLPALPPLLSTLAEFDLLDPGAIDPAALAADRPLMVRALQPVLFGRAAERSGSLDSIPASLSRLRALAALSRDRLSSETWRIIQSLEDLVHGPLPTTLSAFRPTLQRAILYQTAFNGTCRENLTRSEGWRFLNIGHRLERALWLVTLADQLLACYPDLQSATLDAALSVADCTLTYRFRYQGAPTVLPTFDLLLYDPANPRGLIYQLAELDRDLADLPAPQDETMRPAHRTVLRALHHLQTEMLPAGDPDDEARAIEDLHRFVIALREDLPAVSEQLGWEFFTHATFTAS